MRCASSRVSPSPFSRSAPGFPYSQSSRRSRAPKRRVCWSATGEPCARRRADSVSLTSCFSFFSPTKQKIAHRVPEAEAARFEFRRRPRAERRGGRLEQRLAREHLFHVLRVFGPVCGGVQDAADLELARRARGEFRLHQPALVVPLLRPWVGKEEVNRRERAVTDH